MSESPSDFTLNHGSEGPGLLFPLTTDKSSHLLAPLDPCAQICLFLSWAPTLASLLLSDSQTCGLRLALKAGLLFVFV